ncbi:hypothetical protein FS842_007309, partial [Serendipita sp. 407]
VLVIRRPSQFSVFPSSSSPLNLATHKSHIKGKQTSIQLHCSSRTNLVKLALMEPPLSLPLWGCFNILLWASHLFLPVSAGTKTNNPQDCTEIPISWNE